MNEPKKQGRAHNWGNREISRTQMVPRVAELTGMTYQAVDLVIDTLLDQIKQTLAGGKAVQFRGFGSWSLRQTKAKLTPVYPYGKNGMTMLPARLKIRFRPAPHFQQMIPGWYKPAYQIKADAARAAKIDHRFKANRQPVEEPK